MTVELSDTKLDASLGRKIGGIKAGHQGSVKKARDRHHQRREVILSGDGDEAVKQNLLEMSERQYNSDIADAVQQATNKLAPHLQVVVARQEALSQYLEEGREAVDKANQRLRVEDYELDKARKKKLEEARKKRNKAYAAADKVFNAEVRSANSSYNTFLKRATGQRDAVCDPYRDSRMAQARKELRRLEDLMSILGADD